MKIALFSLLLILIQMAPAHAEKPIGFGQLKNLSASDQALVHRMVRITSVVIHDEKKGDYTESCTASIIENKILLTAGHCKTIYPEGARFSINGEESFTAVKVATLSSLLAKDNPNPPVEGDAHDLSMVLVKPDRGSEAVFNRSQRFKVATQPAAHEKVNRVLIAGYGSQDVDTQVQSQMSVDFEAGYVSLARSDFGVFKMPDYVDLAFAYHSPYAQMIEVPLIYQNVHRYQLGEKQYGFTNGSMKVIDSAVPLAGDSGSPMISFTEEGMPEIVGVFSSSAQKSLNDITLVRIKVKGVPQPIFSQKRYNLDSQFLDKKLKELKLLDEEGKATADFDASASQLMTQVGAYSSVFDAKNAAFIRDTLAQFKRTSVK